MMIGFNSLFRTLLKLRSLSKLCPLCCSIPLINDATHDILTSIFLTWLTMSQSLDPTYPLYSVLSFLGFVVSLIPFSWHLQAWNVGTCAYMFWVSFACLREFVNSVVWAGNLDNNIPVWCDISNHFPLLHYYSRSDRWYFFSNKVFTRSGRWNCRFCVVY
jgi:multidrug transporter EmrE-like cation transporter